MKIAVTGANGHVGANLCRLLIAEGHRVKALVHENKQALEGLNVELIHGNVNDQKSLSLLCENVEVVFHLAARISIDGQKDKLLEVNVEGTKNLLNTIKTNRIKRLIYFSSIHALSHFPLDHPMDETRPLVTKGPMWYEITKSRAEKLVLDATLNGLDAVVLNPTAIMGPNDYKPSLLGDVLIRLYKNKLPVLVPGGYNFVDVRDVALGAISAMIHGKKGERYILGGKWLSVVELAELVENVTGKHVTKFIVPSAVAMTGVPFIKAYAKLTRQEPLYTVESLRVLREGNRMIDTSKANKDLNYVPRDLKITIRDTLDWFSGNGYLD